MPSGYLAKKRVGHEYLQAQVQVNISTFRSRLYNNAHDILYRGLFNLYEFGGEFLFTRLAFVVNFTCSREAPVTVSKDYIVGSFMSSA